MNLKSLLQLGFREHLIIVISGIVSLFVFRLYLLPNTAPLWLDSWREVQTFHLGLANLEIAAGFVCLATVAVWISYYPLVSKDADRFGLWLATGAWLSMTVITILTSFDQTQLIGRQTNILLGYISGLLAARTFRRVDTYITALIGCGMAQSIIAIIYHSKSINVFMSGDVARACGTFTNPNDLYLIALFILPLAVQRILSSKNSLTSAFYMMSSASMAAALTLTWVRSGFIAVCVGLFWLMRSYLNRRAQLIAVFVGAALIFGIFFQRSNGPVNQISANRSIESRSFLLKEGIATFAHHPLTGIGLGRLTLPVPVKIDGKDVNFQMIQPYNQFLFWLDEMGIIGGIIIGFFAFFINRSISKSQPNLSRSVASVWIAVAAAGLFNTIFGCYDFSCGNMLIGSLLGITMRLNPCVQSEKSSEVA